MSQTFKTYDRFKKFSQRIFKVSLPEAITFMYKLDQACTDDAQKNYLWYEGGLSFLHFKKYWGYHLSTGLVESKSEWVW